MTSNLRSLLNEARDMCFSGLLRNGVFHWECDDCGGANLKLEDVQHLGDCLVLRINEALMQPVETFARQPIDCKHERASIKCPDCGIDFVGKMTMPSVEPSPVKAIADQDPNERCGNCDVKRSLHDAGGVGSCRNWRAENGKGDA